jgi:hypothetical protein
MMSSAAGAPASVPDRATATYYAAPPATHAPQISLSGQSTTVPAAIQGYVHAAEKRYADSWYWGERTVFAARAIVYAGYCQGRLISELHFYRNGSQLTYERQYVIHHTKTTSGDDVVAVDYYKCDGTHPEQLDGQTQYVSRVIGGKSYLTTVDRSGRYGSYHKHLDIQWTATGVRASITQERAGTQDLALKANGAWLKQNFDLWEDFGLKFQ